MLQLSKREDRSLLFLTFLGTREGLDTSAKMIAERFSMELPYAINILKDLTRGGLLKSKRGPHGGYSLAKATQDISVADVLEALSTPFNLTDCCRNGKDAKCGLYENCFLVEPNRILHDKILAVLEGTTIGDFQQHATRP